jgi:hypothetical protein
MLNISIQLIRFTNRTSIRPGFVRSFGAKGAQLSMPRLFDQVKDLMRRRHYSDRTELIYIHWIQWFILFK